MTMLQSTDLSVSSKDLRRELLGLLSRSDVARHQKSSWRTMEKKHNATCYHVPIVLQCWSSNEHHNGGCDLAVVDLSEDLIATTRERQAVFETIDNERKDVYSFQFWDASPGFFELSCPELERACASEDFQRNCWTILPNAISLPDSNCQRLDSCWVEHDTYGFQWRAMPKQANFYITTIGLKMQDLPKCARRGLLTE